MIYSTIARFFRLVLALLLAIPTLASAQDWAQAVLFPGTKFAMDGVVTDSLLGTFPSSTELITTSATDFTDGEGTTGSFTYVKLSPTTAQLTYTSSYWEAGEGVTESGVLSLNYTSAGSGSYIISSSYIVYLNEGQANGSYTENGSFSQIFPPAPSPPVIGNIAKVSTLQGVTENVSFTISDPVTAAEALTVSVVSSNTALVPHSNISLGGSGSNRTVTLRPVANQWGTSTITITVSNGSTSANTSFVLAVAENYSGLDITGLGQASTEMNTTIEMPFIVAAVDTPAESLTFVINSAVPTLVPLENISVSGTGNHRTLIVTPLPNVTGTLWITVTVRDGMRAMSDVVSLTITQQTIASWRQLHFGSRENQGEGADLNDFDGDGMVNLLEYALGSLPKDPSSVTRPVIVRETSGGSSYLSLTLTKPAYLPGITFKAEVSSDLSEWTSASPHVGLDFDSPTAMKFVTLQGNSDKRFMRLVVTAP